MERELPVIEICGTRFLVDVVKEELRQKDNPRNTIAFYEMMQNDRGFVLCYDRASKTAFRGQEGEYRRRSSELELVQLPPSYQLDQEAFLTVVSRGLRAGLEQLMGTHHLPEAVIAMRRQMETMMINGKSFTIDIWTERLIDDTTGKTIHFSDMIPWREQLLFWYDPAAAAIFRGSIAERNARNDLIRVEVPVTCALLPGYAMNYALSQDNHLKQNR
ncbi:MAG TPA: hypothetical protein VF408_03275 [Sediminibacterium sp.]